MTCLLCRDVWRSRKQRREPPNPQPLIPNPWFEPDPPVSVYRFTWTLYYPRYNQVDLNLKKNFRYGPKTFSGQIDFFNLLNGNAIFARQDAVGNSLGDVTTILQGRLIRLAFQMKF